MKLNTTFRKYVLSVFCLTLSSQAFATEKQDVETIKIAQFGFTLNKPKAWKEYTPNNNKTTNFRFPWMKPTEGELVMFGIATTTKNPDLKIGALANAKSKTLQRGGILYTGKSSLLTLPTGDQVYRTEFTYGKENKKLNRYYIKNQAGNLCWINVYYKTVKSAQEIEQILLNNIKPNKANKAQQTDS